MLRRQTNPHKAIRGGALPYVVIYYVLTAGRLNNRGERYNRDFPMPSAYWLTACPWWRFRFECDDAVAASPLKIDGDSMQSKLGSDAAQFAAELADRFGPAVRAFGP